jgi:hypothetical protein
MNTYSLVSSWCAAFSGAMWLVVAALDPTPTHIKVAVTVVALSVAVVFAHLIIARLEARQ